MNIRIPLSVAAALALASIVSAEQIVRTDPYTGENVTTRIPGSVEIVPPRLVSPSFEPMKAPRGPCPTMVLTSTTEPAPVYSSFARMPAERHPVVNCAPAVMPVQAVAFVEPPPVYVAPEPVPEPYVAPAYVAPPLPAELPHTASPLPLIGLLGLLALGGAAALRARRSFLS